MTAADVDVQVDEHTEADIAQAARCEMKWAPFLRVSAVAAVRIGPVHKCDRQAAWIVRSIFECGRHTTELFCDEHLAGADDVVPMCNQCCDTTLLARNAEKL